MGGRANRDEPVEGRAMSALKLFEHIQFNGASQELEVGQFDAPQLTLADAVSSLRVNPGNTAILYRDANFSGPAQVYSDDARDLGAAVNDSISSAIVLGPVDAPVVYADINFRGDSQVLLAGRFEGTVLTVGDKRISSVRVPKGWNVTLYRQPGFLDTAVHLVSDASELGAFNDQTSSVVVTGPVDAEASAVLRDRLRSLYEGRVPGCVYYVSRNGKPYADGSFGMARMANATDGALTMSSEALVHIASVGKLICGVAVLRMFEEWNAILANSSVDSHGVRHYLGSIAPADASFVAKVIANGATLTLDSAMFPLLAGFLDTGLLASYSGSYPGAGVATVTLRQLLSHNSGLANDYLNADLGGASRASVDYEPPGEGSSHVNLAKTVAALLRRGAGFGNAYNNQNYNVLSAILQAVTGMHFTVWAKRRIFPVAPNAQFADIARYVIDPARSARYYLRNGAGFEVGVHHPDYSDFGGAGGWYVSARAICEWLDAVMQRTLFNGHPILANPDLLLTDLLGVGAYPLSRLQGFDKNGGTSPGGGSTNCRIVYLRGYGSERVCAFALANADIDANPLLDAGLEALRERLARVPGAVAVPASLAGTGLLMKLYWSNGGTIGSACAVTAAVLRSGVGINSVTADRTDLLGNEPLPGGKSRSDTVMAELTGTLTLSGPGMHRFRLSSDDGALLWVDGRLVIDNDGDHPLRSVESRLIAPGLGNVVALRIRWYNKAGDGLLLLEWKTPGGLAYQPVPAANFRPAG